MNINTSPKQNKILGLAVDSRPASVQMKALRLVERVERVVETAQEKADRTFKAMLPKFPHKNL